MRERQKKKTRKREKEKKRDREKEIQQELDQIFAIRYSSIHE